MGTITHVGIGRGGQGWGSCRLVGVESSAKCGEGTPRLRCAGSQVLVGVEHPCVQVADGGSTRLFSGEQEDAGGKGSGGVGEYRPDEGFGIPDSRETIEIRFVPVDQHPADEQPETTDGEREGRHRPQI